MGSGQSITCPGDAEPICPQEGGGPQGGGAHLGDKNVHTETTSYVSVGLFNMYLTTTITSSGLLLGVALGLVFSGVLWAWVEKKRRKKAKHRVEQDKEKDKASQIEESMRKVISTGTHSSAWPAFRQQPAIQHASAPQQSPQHQAHHQLVPLAWGH